MKQVVWVLRLATLNPYDSVQVTGPKNLVLVGTASALAFKFQVKLKMIEVWVLAIRPSWE